MKIKPFSTDDGDGMDLFNGLVYEGKTLFDNDLSEKYHDILSDDDRCTYLMGIIKTAFAIGYATYGYNEFFLGQDNSIFKVDLFSGWGRKV